MKKIFFSKIILFILFSFAFFPQASIAWTREINFEGGANGVIANGGGSLSFDYVRPAAEGGQVTFSNTHVHSGSMAVKFHHQADVPDFTPCVAEIDYPSESNQIWARLYVYLPSGYNFGCYSGDCSGTKFYRIWSGGHWLTMNLGDWGSREIVIENEAADLRTHSGVDFDIGVWQAIEMYVKFGSNGIIRVWKNGNLIINWTGNTGSGGNLSYIRSQWNGNPPANQDDWFDDIVYTNETPAGRDASGNPMIGPIGGTNPVNTAPAAPTGVKVI